MYILPKEQPYKILLTICSQPECTSQQGNKWKNRFNVNDYASCVHKTYEAVKKNLQSEHVVSAQVHKAAVGEKDDKTSCQ